MDPFVVAATYGIGSLVVIPMVFALFKAPYELLDIVLCAIAAAPLSLIPTIGGLHR